MLLVLNLPGGALLDAPLVFSSSLFGFKRFVAGGAAEDEHEDELDDELDDTAVDN